MLNLEAKKMKMCPSQTRYYEGSRKDIELKQI